jgi:hypothetical protein
MANFQQALDWLNDGKRVRIKYWNDADTKFIEKKLLITALIDDLGNEFKIPMCYLYNNDWELYEQKTMHFCQNYIETSYCKEVLSGEFFFSPNLQESYLVNFCPFCGKKSGK